nr:MAG TPA: hypothetical protein [Caudoviricetes sp.]
MACTHSCDDQKRTLKVLFLWIIYGGLSFVSSCCIVSP